MCPSARMTGVDDYVRLSLISARACRSQLSKLLPPTGVRQLDAVRDDVYFCVLLPMMVPTTLIAVYANWVSMKYFKHA
jgi:hypothetical protein